MTLNEDQLRQRLARLADHARPNPTIGVRELDERRPPPTRSRWAAAAALAAAAAAVVVFLAVFPLRHATPGRVIQSGPSAPNTGPGPALSVPTTVTIPLPTLPATTAALRPALEPPDAGGPAAGGCLQAQIPTGNITIGADMAPQPRCLIIRHDQHLSITNDTNHTITPTLGTHFKMTLAPGQTATFAAPLGTYLAPGVHHLAITAVSTADIWIDAICQGPGAVNCTTP